MSARSLIWRCIERLAKDAGDIGLADDELAALFLQAATDRAVSVAGTGGAAAWLSRLADALREDSREFRRAAYLWLDGLPVRLDFAVVEARGDGPHSAVRSLILGEKLRRLLEEER